MSTQETRLREIADAIREKEGSTEPIPANAFASRILLFLKTSVVKFEQVTLSSR